MRCQTQAKHFLETLKPMSYLNLVRTGPMRRWPWKKPHESNHTSRGDAPYVPHISRVPFAVFGVQFHGTGGLIDYGMGDVDMVRRSVFCRNMKPEPKSYPNPVPSTHHCLPRSSSMCGKPLSSTPYTRETEALLVLARRRCVIPYSSRCFRRYYCVSSYRPLCRLTVNLSVEWVSVRIFPLVIPDDMPELYVLTTYSLLLHCSSNSFVLVTMNKEVGMLGYLPVNHLPDIGSTMAFRSHLASYILLKSIRSVSVVFSSVGYCCFVLDPSK